MLESFLSQQWDTTHTQADQQNATNKLENGHILYFPKLMFELKEKEKHFLTPDYADPHSKNISYHPEQHKIWGVQRLPDQARQDLKAMLDRYYKSSLNLLRGLLPQYAPDLITGRTSYRPIQICGRRTSPRKDDKRLHVDAFPSAPNQGKRILRIFCNINPHHDNRVWRVGEPFEQVAEKFLPRIKHPLPLSSTLLRFLRITKSYRTQYDHYMLYLHDLMKMDDHYQKTATQETIAFPPNTTWMVQTDQVSHAAMQGQYVLEQTFYLPIQAMQNEGRSPLRILERLTGKVLV